jgi:hypothetical protein
MTKRLRVGIIGASPEQRLASLADRPPEEPKEPD